MAKKRKNQNSTENLQTPKSDFGTPELHERHVVRVNSTQEGRRARVITQLYIDILHHRGHISEHQHDAATRIYEFYFRAGRVPIRAMPLDAIRVDTSIVGDRMWESESQVDNWIRLNKTLDGMEAITRLIVLRACCHESMADELTRDMRKPRYYVLERLREGLDIAALNLGIISPQQYESCTQTHRADYFVDDLC